VKGAQNRRCSPKVEPKVRVDADLDTLATALYVRTDDLLKVLRVREPGLRMVRTPDLDVHVHIWRDGDPAVTATWPSAVAPLKHR
jgi:hypothetical protein